MESRQRSSAPLFRLLTGCIAHFQKLPPSIIPVFNDSTVDMAPIKGYFPTPDIAYFFNMTSGIEAKNWWTPDIQISARHMTLYFQKAKNGCTINIFVSCILQLDTRNSHLSLWGQQYIECRIPQANKDLGLCRMLTVEGWYIIHHCVQPYKSIYFFKSDDLCFPKIYTFMGVMLSDFLVQNGKQ